MFNPERTKMMMNERKRFHIEPFYWLHRTLKGSYFWTLKKGSV